MKGKTGWVDFKEVKAEVGIEDILGHYGLLGDLRRKGDELVGYCPIHDRKRQYNKGAFWANTDKNAFQCFACGASGNILDFVMAMEGVEVREAALLVQDWFQVGEGEELAKGKEAPPEPGPRESAEPGEVNPPLTFELKLEPEHSYLEERGLEEKTVQHFGLGFASRGIMAGRIAIPIHNERGELVAYAGRWPGDEGWPEDEDKYKLPSNFHKHLILYNLHRAQEFADEGLILVEGFFDVFELWQEGTQNVVALMGVFLSEAQEKLLLEVLGPEGKLTLRLDPDEAGREATQEITEMLITQLFIKVEKGP